MTTFGSQIASHIASVVVTEFKVTPLIKAHHMDIFIQLYLKKKKEKANPQAFLYQLLTRTVKAYGTSSLMNNTEHFNLMKPLEP